MWVGRHIDSSHTLILSFRNTGGVVSVFVSDGLFNVIKKRGSAKRWNNCQWVVRYNLLLVRVWLLNPVVVHIQQNKEKIG